MGMERSIIAEASPSNSILPEPANVILLLYDSMQVLCYNEFYNQGNLSLTRGVFVKE